MFKNVASQKVAVFAWDNAAGAAKTGDAANITAQISKDGAATAATDDVNPTELDAADAPGIYIFDMLQAETNADLVVIVPVSATSDIVLRPVIIYTQTVMKGTDSAALASVCTEARLAELDSVNDLSSAQVETAVDNAFENAIPATPTADSINDYIQRLKWCLVNLMTITEATGNTVIYKDDDSTPAATVAAAFASDGVTTTRKRLE